MFQEPFFSRHIWHKNPEEKSRRKILRTWEIKAAQQVTWANDIRNVKKTVKTITITCQKVTNLRCVITTNQPAESLALIISIDESKFKIKQSRGKEIFGKEIVWVSEF